jgi:hypothetical protein
MDLEVESGQILRDVKVEDVFPNIQSEAFAILSVNSDTYLQCAVWHQTKTPLS